MVPISPVIMAAIIDIHGLSALDNSIIKTQLWPWHRVQAWREIKKIMQRAGISGVHATPKGLRHGFAIHAIQSGVSINLVQRWLGHASLSTTAIYTEAVGPEERLIAARMWQFEDRMLEGSGRKN
ncbi:tyrosine-type recombinase/integrase [uncultured Cohaesibacter sp.]|uniref:tyrosine-type recombinase/integrase n=1 Tax=uncultured Cohaesibacter sp. TaxID=1002546 RepID=UPI0029314B42